MLMGLSIISGDWASDRFTNRSGADGVIHGIGKGGEDAGR